jgi:ubiquinone/menaquinone biosynthesis C-methylase UbiE
VRTLTQEQAKSFYDGFGSKQDKQSFYEEGALSALVANAAFDHARSVFELGCGTGRFASDLLNHHLPAAARYFGTDISSTMVALASKRLAPFASRTRVAVIKGQPKVPVDDASVDRFVSTYVFDLLPASEQLQWLAEAARVLRPNGLLCLAGITYGITPISRVAMGLWQQLFALSPRWVGGCRPTRLLGLLGTESWNVRFRAVVVSCGVASEVVVAAPMVRTTHAEPFTAAERLRPAASPGG